MEQPLTELENVEIPEEIKERTRKELISLITHKDVQAFIKEHDMKSNDPRILDSYAAIKEYVHGGIYRGYEPTLSVKYGWVSIDYIRSTTAEAKRIHQGFLTHRRFDKVTEKYKNATLESIYKTEGKASIIRAIEAFVNEYTFGEVNHSGWVCGDFGRGKTYAMGALASEMHKAGHGVYFVNFNQFLRDLTSRMGYKGNEYNEFFDQHERYEVMIIDDIGQEQVSNFTVKAVLKRILEERASAGLSTWFTSNLTQKEYLDRLKSSSKGDIDFMDVRYIQERIELFAREIIVKGENLRAKAKDATN